MISPDWVGERLPRGPEAEHLLALRKSATLPFDQLLRQLVNGPPTRFLTRTDLKICATGRDPATRLRRS
jgi:hypothetical protein